MSKLVPNLRFKEFSGEWEEKKLKNVFSIFQGFSFLSKDSVTNGVRWLKISDVGIQHMSNESPSFLPSNYAKEYQKFTLKKGDYVIALTRPILNKKLKIAPINAIFDGALLNQRVGKLVTSQNINFIYFLLQTSRMIKELENSISGTEPPNLSAQKLEDINIFIPKPKEQKKIANCLSSLDNLIEAQNKKAEALKEYKKGLMQQLFPSEGKTVPKRRFKEFSEEWESKILDDISDIVRGGSPRPIDDYMTLSNDGLNWLKIADVDKNSKYVTHTKERVKKSALSKTREVDIGDLILSNSMSFGRPYIMKIKSCIHDGWIAVTNIESYISSDYLYYIILSPTSQKFFIDYAAGGGIRNLNADIIKSLPISFPKEKQEQQKIANCLSSLDNLIEAQNKKVEALKQHKKGLMQQLFVSSEGEL